jgi:hypothetical protein
MADMALESGDIDADAGCRGLRALPREGSRRCERTG